MKSAKKTAWFCSNCGNEYHQWMGRCPACGEWNTLVEEPVGGHDPEAAEKDEAYTSRKKSFLGFRNQKPESLDKVAATDENRMTLGSVEVDRLLGGGLVEGSLVLLGGEPGIGKSTLSLQVALHCKGLNTLYVSGEESPKQIKLRAQRLGGNQSQCQVLGETVLENIVKIARETGPDILVIDSIQTVYSEKLDASAGSVSQVKECASALLRMAKATGIPVILVGHITKDGTIAGPKVLEHIVDVVLQFEGDSRGAYRILRSMKNRFGSTDEIAVFEMTGAGLREVTNPSELFIPMHKEDLSGIAIGSMLDGTRPLMIEVQALVSSAAYGMPQRSATGFDVRRLNMLLAVLEKRAGFRLGSKDVFLNMAGGLRVGDPAIDLAVVVAVLSSNLDIPVSQRCCFAAEVGLSGEIRPVTQVERRIAEARKLGFEEIFVSSFNKDSALARIPGDTIGIVPVPDIGSVLKHIGR
ncbi:MAG: DNA repair protein RadA [Bacteroidales bacterium]|jgi:DNA repair protein RadA/Sms|nr:DNA repair protein RadA [Bacteroidales bacterium]MCI2121261.1 DNA repair protein RadA [Bacteroidales bacterium]MCI2146143.1 DNA repair protein RadA [Bacteroidales bacterium]